MASEAKNVILRDTCKDEDCNLSACQGKKASYFISQKLGDHTLMTSQMAAVPQARCQERWLELQFTFRGEAQCWSIPQLRIWLLPVGVCTVGFLPIWIHQVRGCISTQQLWNWHALDCLLTVIFLLDFIKTPSVVSTDKESNQKYPWRVCMCTCVSVCVQLCCRIRSHFIFSFLLSSSFTGSFP